jgi:Ni,Fe-hydrogenase III large subunit
MKYYKFGDKTGRYIGRTEKYDVYTSTITEIGKDEDDHEERTQGEIYFNYGPSAGGLRESVNFQILTPGESIRDVIINSGFKRRNIKIKGDSISDAMLKVERINGFHSASHSIAYALAVEEALNVENGDLNDARIVEIELERIRSNIDVIKGLCESAGFAVPEKQLLLLREEVARIISSAFGHRYYFSVNGINSIDADFSRISLSSIEKQFRTIYDGLLSSKIFLDRLQENGILLNPVSNGPAARAANFRYDARLDSESLVYGKYSTIMETSGDTFSRFLVRAEEIFESINIIESYDIKKSYRKHGMELNGTGEGTARIESPAGDLFYYVNINEGKLIDIQMCSPSYLNMRNFRYALKSGNIFTDFFFVWESFGIWLSELEVRFQ